MAVYQHRYKPYEGRRTSAWQRFLVVPRYAYADLAKSNYFIALLLAGAVCPLVFMIFIYTHHNVNAIKVLGINPGDLLRIDVTFFYAYLWVQSLLAFVFTVIIGPVLISRDLANNGLPLYLSRPFSRAEYIVGKMSVLGILLSGITWVPGVLLFLFQCYLAGREWWSEYWSIGPAIVCGSLALIVLLAMLSMAISAWVRWRSAASGALVAIFMFPLPIGVAVKQLFGSRLGHLLSPGMALDTIAQWLLGRLSESASLSIGQAWAVWLVYALVSLWMLSRKLRAWEVVS